MTMKKLINIFLKVNFYLCLLPFVVAGIQLLAGLLSLIGAPAEDVGGILANTIVNVILSAASGVVAFVFDRLAKKELALVKEKSQVTKAAVFAIISGAFAWVGFGVAAGILMFILKPEGYPIVDEAPNAEETK